MSRKNLPHNKRLTNILARMKYRCSNKNNERWDRYGGRGITVCDEWKNSFMSFYEWAIDNGYSDDLTLDRIDPDGNYEPSNCRWATKSIQSMNSSIKRKNNTSGYRGVCEKRGIKNRYESKIQVDYKLIFLGVYDSAIEAAISRDTYIVENNLYHTLNDVLKSDLPY